MNFTIYEVDSSENSNTFSLNNLQNYMPNFELQNIPMRNILTQNINTNITSNEDVTLNEMNIILNSFPIDDESKKLKIKYFINENYDSSDELNLLKICQKEKNRSFDLSNSNDREEYLNWKVDKIIIDIETIQENYKNKSNENMYDINEYDSIINHNHVRNHNENNFNLDEINFILNNVNLDEIKNILTSRIICLCRSFRCKLCNEKNENLIIKQLQLFEQNLNLLINNYECNNLNTELFMRKNTIVKANVNFSILAEVLYILFKNNLSYDVLEVKNKLRINYNINNFSNYELKFTWIYKNQNGEFFIKNERELMKKFEIILQSLSSKIGLCEEYNYYNFFKRYPNIIIKLFNILKGLFLLNELN